VVNKDFQYTVIRTRRNGVTQISWSRAT